MARIQCAGMSRSVRSSLTSPPPRTASRDDQTPCTIGLNSEARVHSAATPMVPAPRKRTCELHSCVARSVTLCPTAGTALTVSSGTATPQAITRPMRMAMPAVMPIR
ncbi:hypothetical protein D9M71_436070 [compost metagenome]